MRAQRSSLVVLAAALLASCASFSDLPSDLQQSAQCIAESLRSTPGISDVGLSADVDRSESQAGTFAVIRYSFVDETNEQHQVEFGLYKDTRIASGHIYNSAIAEDSNNPSAAVLPANSTLCGCKSAALPES